MSRLEIYLLFKIQRKTNKGEDTDHTDYRGSLVYRGSLLSKFFKAAISHTTDIKGL